jgi:Ca2+-binding RTX toxin-like protein
VQDGDRFYYFNQLKDAPLLIADIGSQHFSDIVMRNTGLDHMHYDVFAVSERIDLGGKERSHDFSTLAVDTDKVLVLVGNKHDNTITGTAGDDTIYGEVGDDTLNGGLGLDALFGGDGDDTLNTGDGTRGVFAYGQGGDDIINGNVGDDNLIGGAGDDRIRGASGKDFLSGGAGDDWLMPGAGLNIVDGGDGNDTVDYSDSTVGLEVDLSFLGDHAAGTGGYQGDLIGNVENVVGSNFADTLTGDDADNDISGGGGDDTLVGLGGDDRLSGDGGSDTFVFASGFGNDRITDFDANPAGGQDLLDISAFGISADNFMDHVKIADAGPDTLVTINGDPAQTIRLAGIGSPTMVTQQDFLLVG